MIFYPSVNLSVFSRYLFWYLEKKIYTLIVEISLEILVIKSVSRKYAVLKSFWKFSFRGKDSFSPNIQVAGQHLLPLFILLWLVSLFWSVFIRNDLFLFWAQWDLCDSSRYKDLQIICMCKSKDFAHRCFIHVKQMWYCFILIPTKEEKWSLNTDLMLFLGEYLFFVIERDIFADFLEASVSLYSCPCKEIWFAIKWKT